MHSVNRKQSRQSQPKGRSRKSGNSDRTQVLAPGVPVIRPKAMLRGLMNSCTIIKRTAPIDLTIEGVGGANPGFYYTGTQYGSGMSMLLNGCGQLVTTFTTGNLGSNFIDMSSYAQLYDEFKVKKVWLDCFFSVNSVSPSGTATALQASCIPIIQIVFDPNSNVVPTTVSTLLSYENVEFWHPNVGEARRLIEFVPVSNALSTGIELKQPQWIQGANYISGSTLGNLKFWVDTSMCTGGFQGVMTVYPIIEVEWRRQL